MAMGFLIGLLTGAVIALLYAPKPGDITREELRQRSDELKRRADELQRIATDLSQQAQVKGKELAGEAKKQWERYGSTARSGEGGSAAKS
ncbi:MAG TPA: YtxH domain-containing protein [Candidatus Limnocylindria bacterium]|jgi:gas vesicle protein|nr:YtxH domain-containing protein [Candidatus Limnocylindria bacterium]